MINKQLGPAHHSSCIFVQSMLPLKLHRNTRCLAGDEICGPEPNAERRVTALHHRASQEAGLASTRAAFQNTGAGCDVEGFANHAQCRQTKP
jgi:hypothetical protein